MSGRTAVAAWLCGRAAGGWLVLLDESVPASLRRSI